MTTANSRPVSMISSDYNANPVIKRRPIWWGRRALRQLKFTRIALLPLMGLAFVGCKEGAGSTAPAPETTQSALIKASRSGGDFQFAAGTKLFRFRAVDAATLPANPDAAPFELHLDDEVTRVMADGTRNAMSLESSLDEIEGYAALTKGMSLQRLAVLKIGTSADDTQIHAVIKKLGEEGFGTIALDLSEVKTLGGESGLHE